MKTAVHLRDREYWTFGQCAQLYPQSAQFFRKLLLQGHITGFTRRTARTKRTYLNAESVRAYFRALELTTRQEQRVNETKPRRTMRDLLAADPRIQALRAKQADV